MDFRRGSTSQELLKIDWLHPVPPTATGNSTEAKGPLSLVAALQVLWEAGDDRPLLVLRECTLCQGGDDALFDGAKVSERTLLLTKWFRTVRLPPHAAWETHPFYNVFGGYEWPGATPHFFLLSEPGATPVEFSGTQTQSQLQRGMCDVLEARYAKNPLKAVKKCLSILDELDTLDARKLQFETSLAEERAARGADSERAKRLNKDLEETVAARDEVLQRLDKTQDLGLLPMSRAAFATAASK